MHSETTQRRLSPQMPLASAESTAAARAHFADLLGELLPACISLDMVLSDQRYLSGVITGLFIAGVIDVATCAAWRNQLTAACNARLVELRQAKAQAA